MQNLRQAHLFLVLRSACSPPPPLGKLAYYWGIPKVKVARAGGIFAAAKYKTAACHYKCIVNAKDMDADTVLDNWSDIESDESDVSSEGDEESEESVEESEESSDDEEDTLDSWKEVPGLCI